jgi:hypothetical protein
MEGSKEKRKEKGNEENGSLNDSRRERSETRACVYSSIGGKE